MRLIKNTGNDRVIDELRTALVADASLDVAASSLSLFAFSELRELLGKLNHCRMILPTFSDNDSSLLGSDADRPFRNQLQSRWLARQCSDWIKAMLGAWFSSLWEGLAKGDDGKKEVLHRLQSLTDHQPPALIYHLILYHLFQNLGEDFDEERIVKSATGIRNTLVWKKLYKFQRDGVVGAIDKLERLGGCIIADSVGLGKTFEALAIIKYYELRNDRVLVLVPKRLRDNWTLYKSNDRRNFLAVDRFNYDVLNHTDLSRDGGNSGDINLAHVNWGNYDLVVIDESHNFRNKATHRDRDTRYDRLMKRIIKSGVKTKVLMLSATPVNNRLSDLKNQIAFITEGDDTALVSHGIQSIETTIRQAQSKFNQWLIQDDKTRTPGLLLEMLGFDYFTMLDLLTIARSRKHIEKYYGTDETGKFPERLPPINIKTEVDISCEFRSIREINLEIRRLNLSAYAPLRYILLNKQALYDEKYSTKVRGGESIFRQADREESLVHLLRVNILKRMESSVTSFALTLKRQLEDVEALLAKIDAHTDGIEEISIDDVEIDDPEFESLLIGRKVKVLLQDVDRVRWRQDLLEDRNRLDTLLSAARQIEPARDNLEQTLLDHAEHIVAGCSEQDILYELLLKLGLDLTVPIEQKTVAGKTVHSIGGGALLVCLSDSIDREVVEPLAQGIIGWHKELKPAVDTRIVFRDSAFADDVAKTNLAAILQQHGLDDVRSL